MFAPIVLGAPNWASLPEVDGKTSTIEARPHSVELDIAGTSVFIWRDAEPAMVRTIISALKASQ